MWCGSRDDEEEAWQTQQEGWDAPSLDLLKELCGVFGPYGQIYNSINVLKRWGMKENTMFCFCGRDLGGCVVYIGVLGLRNNSIRLFLAMKLLVSFKTTYLVELERKLLNIL